MVAFENFIKPMVAPSSEGNDLLDILCGSISATVIPKLKSEDVCAIYTK